jgi:hypothetical protein
MKKAVSLPVMFAGIVIACSTSPSSFSPSTTGDDGGTFSDAGGASVGDGAPTDAGEDAVAACTSAACKTQADCQEALGGIVGCWQCKVGCCVAIPNGQDPGAACGSMATACTKGVCGGNGGCSKENLAAGTACGFVCNPNTADQQIEAKCDAEGTCAVDFLSNPSFRNCSAGTCAGASDKCHSCPPSGCAVTCSSDAGVPSCP